MERVTQVEARYIINAVRSHSGYDLGGYSLANLRLVLGQFSAIKAIRYTDLLINKLIDDSEQMEELLYSLELPDLEMFRDPEFWLLMRTKILPSLSSRYEQVKIWIPHNSSGEELFSLLIILHELELNDRFSIKAGNISSSRQKEIKEGVLEPRKFQLSTLNYESAGGCLDFKSYFVETENRFLFNLPELGRVDFHIHSSLPEKCDGQFHLVLLRNRLLMFTDQLKLQILGNLAGSMEKRALLILGYREKLPEKCRHFFASDEYIGEQIFKTRD